MRLRASIAAVLLLTGVLAGCTTSAGQDPSPSSSPSGSGSPAATRTPEVTPSGSADPDDPSTWLVMDDGMGPITLGTPFAEALALMPEGTTNDTENCAWSGWWSAPDGDYQVFIARDGDGAEDGPVFLVETAAWSNPSKDLGPRTVDGVGIGSTVDEVRAAYPDVVEVPDPTDSSIVHLQVGRIFFTHGGDRVVTAVTVTTADAPPYEICG